MSDGAELHAQAAARVRSGRPGEAVPLFRRLLLENHAGEPDYELWLSGLAAAYHGLGRTRASGHVLVYLQRYEEAHQAFIAAHATVEAARCRDLWARSQATASPSLQRQAGEAYAEAGLPVHAAIAFSAAGERAAARKSWEKVAADPRLAGRPYEQALCCFNLGFAAAGEVEASGATDGSGARARGKGGAGGRGGDGNADLSSRQLIRAQRLLEEVADDFETAGERERAFDCYAILLELGRKLGSFENLAEGYINCIRVLRDDNLKFYVLQYHEDFLRVALEREELHAAALMAREAADYARSVGLAYDRGYLLRAGEIWCKAAEKNERDGGAVELTENAYLAAVDAYAAAGDFFHVRESYTCLARLSLSDKKRERYHKVAARYAEVSPAPVEALPFPDYLRHQHAYPPIWELDLVEWELDGDLSSVCAAIVGDTHYPAIVRHLALHVVLQQLEPVTLPSRPDGTPRPRARGNVDPNLERLAEVAENLGELHAYSALRPLERLYAHPHPLVRRGVMRALRHLYFKRTFRLVTLGLADEDPGVRAGALEALGKLHFTHAFDPLLRIFRGAADHAVKVAALESIGKVATLEAGELLVEVLRHESEALRDVARRLLVHFDNPEMALLLKRHLELETGPSRELLLQILASRAR